MKRVGVALILVLAFCGLANAIYLTQHELSGTPLICNIQNLSGCNTVTESAYSNLLGIPLSELGVIFYGIIFILACVELLLFRAVLRRVLQVLAAIGVVASLCFTLIQAFLIGAFCIYCLASAFIALLIFICATVIEPLRGTKEQVLSPVLPSLKESLPMPPRP